jgi:hypothetical protein
MTDLVLKTGNCPPEQYSEQFLQGMINRVAISWHKYGPSRLNTNVDWVASALVRIQKYQETGNSEWLIDAANYCMIETLYPRHPNAHHRATDSHESPGRIDLDGKTRFGSISKPKEFHRHEGD